MIKNRGISFQDVADRLIDGRFLDILENPIRKNQQIFILSIQDYTWVVSFTIDEKDVIWLKTAYPSRKFYKHYRGIHEKKDDTESTGNGD
ncbi:toxin [bacterium]|nr:toxin [bacterium]